VAVSGERARKRVKLTTARIEWLWVLSESLRIRMSSIMRWRNGLTGWLVCVMGLLLL
jgi:hypothetical protein